MHCYCVITAALHGGKLEPTIIWIIWKWRKCSKISPSEAFNFFKFKKQSKNLSALVLLILFFNLLSKDMQCLIYESVKGAFLKNESDVFPIIQISVCDD